MNGVIMKRSIKIFLLIIILLLMFSVGPGEAKVYLDIYGKTYKKITVGVPDFKGEKTDKLKIDMADVLNKDLDMSGFFIVAPKSLLDRELTDEGIEKQEIKFGNWRSIGIELLCKGRVLEKDGEVVLESYLYDTTDGTMMLAKRYRARPEDWRKVVHRLADDIVLTVTGEKGIMSSRVLFVSGDRRRKELYSADLDGQNLKKLTEYRSITLLPSVSPGGKYVAFTSYKEGNPNLFIMDLEKRREIHAERGEGMKISGTWLNKSTLSYSHTSGKTSTIYALNVENREKRVLARSDGINTSASFSPDGTKMVFVSDMYGSPQVFLKDLGSGEVKRLTYFGNYNTAPAFSPKGDLIVYVAKFEGSFEICVMNADGSNQRVLTNGGVNDSPQFSPCGRYILYSSRRNAKTGIHVMLFNGDNKRSLKFTEGAEEQPRLLP
jgi:TolB protein